MRMTQSKLVDEFITKPIYPKQAGRVKLCFYVPLLGCVPGRCDGIWYLAISKRKSTQASEDTASQETNDTPLPIAALRIGDIFIVNSSIPSSERICVLLGRALNKVKAPVINLKLGPEAEICWNIGLKNFLYYIALWHLSRELRSGESLGRTCELGAALQYLTGVPCFGQMVSLPVNYLLSEADRNRILDFWFNCFSLWTSIYPAYNPIQESHCETNLVSYFNTLFLGFHGLLNEATLRQSALSVFGSYLWLYFFLVRLFPSLRDRISPNFGLEHLAIHTPLYDTENLKQMIRIYNFQGIALKAMQVERFLPFEDFCNVQ